MRSPGDAADERAQVGERLAAHGVVDPHPALGAVEQADQVAPLLMALADPVRLRLVSVIAASAGGEACVCDLNDAFDLTQATISHHLKVLHSAGLLDRDKRGVWVYYAVKPEALASVATLFDTAALTPA